MADTNKINHYSRKTYIDLLKILAIFMVIFNHTGKRGFVLFTVRQNSPYFFFYLFNSIFIKSAVPLFFMTSGALLIGKNESLKKLIFSRFLKFLLVLLAASMVQYIYICLYYEPQIFSLSTFFTLLYTDGVTIPYWYLYTYLAYILMLPFLRRMAIAMTEKEYLWMFLLYGFMNVLPIIDFLIWQGKYTHNTSFNFFISGRYIFYPLMGYYIDQVMDEHLFSRKIVFLLAIASVISICISCKMTIYKCTITGDWSESTCQTFFSSLTFIPAITIYISTKMLFIRHTPNQQICRIISALGGLTFGIYLIENICRAGTEQVFIFLEQYTKTLPACWIWIIATYLLGACITFLFKKIPGVKKYI